MFRLACLAPLCLLTAGCADVPLPDLSAIGLPAAEAAGPAAREYPVQDAACVNAVRRETRLANVRIDRRTPGGAGGVSYEIAVGGEGQVWACTATAEGQTSGVGLLSTAGAPPATPGAPLSATRPAPARSPAPAPAPTPPADPAPAPAVATPPSDPAPATPAAPPSGPVITPLPSAADAPVAENGLPAPDPRSVEPSTPLPTFNE